MGKQFSCARTKKWQICRERDTVQVDGIDGRGCNCTEHVCSDVTASGTKQVCCVSAQAATDHRCLRAEGPRRNLRRLSTHSWSRPRRAASLHLRATLSRATARRLSLVSNSNALVHLQFRTVLTSMDQVFFLKNKWRVTFVWTVFSSILKLLLKH